MVVLLVMRVRRQISLGDRFRVLERDKYRCRYCGATPLDGIRLEIDHITPVCEGGTNDLDNLITACQPCNLGKHGRVVTKPDRLVEITRDRLVDYGCIPVECGTYFDLVMFARDNGWCPKRLNQWNRPVCIDKRLCPSCVINEATAQMLEIASAPADDDE